MIFYIFCGGFTVLYNMNIKEFEDIVKRFNADKKQYNWDRFKEYPMKSHWVKLKPQINPYPTYWAFKDTKDFLYWLNHSEDTDFISARFCPICGQYLGYTKQGIFATVCPIHKHESIAEKVKKTNLERYGVEYPLQSQEIHQKTINTGNANGSYFIGRQKQKKTLLIKYGDENYNNSKKCSETRKKKYSDPVVREAFKAKQRKTCLERYGDEHYNNAIQTEKTNLKRYGVKNVSYLSEVKEKISKNARITRIKNHTTAAECMADPLKRKAFTSKVYTTKKKNNTFNTSKPEQQIKSLLEQKFPDLQYQYKSEEYPFNCDFYIPSKQLYIEYQGTWSHGKKKYEGTEDDLALVTKWTAKDTKYYKQALYVWTELDPKKRQIAKDNNLNWIEFFNMDQFMKWYNSI